MKVLIYGTPSCTFCKQALQLCNQRGVDTDYKTVGVDIQKEQLQEMVGRPISSVPQIFITSEGLTSYVGGFQDLKKKFESLGTAQGVIVEQLNG
ncbi:hypothetical protein pf16_178 [Pseudomonas phage pf16]|uniref:Glutaredoxin domain-containing protein n=1 Tax=Pseudomonas phage pf16 TaxID=1815630 RepID=A0A1S5R3W1_9CAUD|nr:thioredoxin domain [Pseudomonas phage pf16]AND75101.1 hypothetical protein pf16_178 [Pseudomonas phage pf16]